MPVVGLVCRLTWSLSKGRKDWAKNSRAIAGRVITAGERQAHRLLGAEGLTSRLLVRRMSRRGQPARGVIRNLERDMNPVY